MKTVVRTLPPPSDGCGGIASQAASGPNVVVGASVVVGAAVVGGVAVVGGDDSMVVTAGLTSSVPPDRVSAATTPTTNASTNVTAATNRPFLRFFSGGFATSVSTRSVCMSPLLLSIRSKRTADDQAAAGLVEADMTGLAASSRR